MTVHRTRHAHLNAVAAQASKAIGNIGTNIAVMLGTGWGDAVTLKEDAIPLSLLCGELFGTLAVLPGHARRLGVATIGDTRIIALSGRIHMYEGNRDAVYLLMRILWELGVRKLIMTSASGGMRDYIRKGDIVVVTEIIARCPSPVDGPPFPIPHAMIRHGLMQSIWASAPVSRVHIGHLVTNAGPALESPGNRLAVDQPGVQCVGMSGSPEQECFASFVEQDALQAGKHAFVVPITCISNGLNDPHGHLSNTETMRANNARLASMLTHVVEKTERVPLGDIE